VNKPTYRITKQHK